MVAVASLPAATPEECHLDQNPLGQFCSYVEGHLGGAILGPFLARLLWGLALVSLVLVGGRLLRRVAAHAIERGNGDPQIRSLVDNVLLATTLVLAVLAGITGAGVQISVLLTVAGLSTLAIGLALQDLLRNVLAGIFLLLERPFRIGDLVAIGDISGTVEAIQLRTTSLRLGDGRLAVIPNLSAFNGTVVNATASDLRRLSVPLWVPPGRDLAAALRAARAALDGISGVEAVPPPQVVGEPGPDHGTTLRCLVWVRHRAHDLDEVATRVVVEVSRVLADLEESETRRAAGRPPGADASAAGR